MIPPVSESETYVQKDGTLTYPGIILLQDLWADLIQAQADITTLGGGAVPDGDKGDVVVSGGGTVWTVEPSVTAGLLPLTGGTMTGPIVADISVAAGAGIVMPPGADPTAAVNGSVWMLLGSMRARINGANYSVAMLNGASTFTGKKTFTPATAGSAFLNIAPGVAPSAPVDGDIWETTAGIFAQINGATVQIGGITSAFVGARVFRSTDQSIPTGGAWTSLSYDQAPLQSGGTFWTSGATTTVPETGVYQVFAEATFDGAGLLATITANMQIIVNGVTVVGEDETLVAIGAKASLWVMAQRQFTAGDTFLVQVKHSNATALPVLSQGNHSPDIIFAKQGGPQGAPGPAATSGITTITVPNNRMEWEETVTASGVTGASRIFLSLAPTTDFDENSAEMLSVDAMSATPGTGQITISMAFAEPTAGPIKMNWMAA
jgi:hypothetical protein